MPRVFVRGYIHRKQATEGHSFLVANEQGGVSGRLGSVLLNDWTRSLGSLRYAIQEIDQNGMIKRNPIYEEMRVMMSLSTNPYSLPEESRYLYRLAKITLENADGLPELFSPAQEEEEDFMKVFNPITHDLVLVPLTQIDPKSGSCEPPMIPLAS